MIKRRFIPGSSWLYIKLYTGHKSADDILATQIAPFVKQLLIDGYIKKYFFIRYTDPDHHIRLRLEINGDNTDDKINNPEFYNYVLDAFYKTFEPCLDNNTIWDVTCGTYNREIERYGDKTILLAEDLFFADSECIINLLIYLSTRDSKSSEGYRWKVSLLLIDDILEAFDFNIENKINLLSILSKNFKTEFNIVSNSQSKQLNDKYRLLRDSIELTMSREDESELSTSTALLHRKKEMSRLAHLIKDNLKDNTTPITIETFISSIIHMTMNRLFKTKNRVHELVIYDFLFRYYNSLEARKKYNNFLP